MNRFSHSSSNHTRVGGNVQAINRPGGAMFVVPPSAPPVAPSAPRVYDSFECKDMGQDMSEDEVPVPIGALFDVHEGNLNEALPEVDGDIESPEGWWSFNLPASVEMYLMLEAELDGTGGVIGRRLFLTDSPASFVTADGDPATGNPPSHAWRRIARLVTDSSYGLTIVQYTKGSQQAVVLVSDWSCSTILKRVVWIP